MTTITAGVLGLGSMGVGWHCAQLDRVAGLDLLAGCDPTEARRAAVAAK